MRCGLGMEIGEEKEDVMEVGNGDGGGKTEGDG